MIYLRLAAEFLRIGVFAIGGGLASIPFLYDMASRTGWFNGEDIVNMIAVSESTPGPLGINMATYVGYKVGGPLGGVTATLCTIAPSVLLIVLIAGLLKRFIGSRWVKAAFHGLRPAVTALIAAAFWQVVQVALFDMEYMQAGQEIWKGVKGKAVVLAAVMYLLIQRFRKHPAVYIAASALAGVVFCM